MGDERGKRSRVSPGSGQSPAKLGLALGVQVPSQAHLHPAAPQVLHPRLAPSP